MLNRVKTNHSRPSWLNALFLLSVLAFIPSVSLAQDKIYKIDRTVIEAKVLEINSAEIKYKKFSNPDGPAYIIYKKEVSMIVYANGEKEICNQAQTNGQVKGNDFETLVVNPSIDRARNAILTNNINEAIALYAKLITMDLNNPGLLAEDAYALALGGIYDAALMRLDLCRSMGPGSPDIYFFTSQVFALMGYQDLAAEFWKASEKNKAPAWISSVYEQLLKNHKGIFPASAAKNREELIFNFKHANELASQNSYFQSIALFHDIVYTYPNEFLPYIGYSISLERTGALQKSAQSLEKAISLIGNTTEDRVTKQYLEKRLASIKQNMTLISPYAMPQMPLIKEPDADRPQMMAYAGGMVAPSLTNLNCRIGYFIAGSTNASLDFGLLKSAETSFSNIGLSIYSMKNGFVTGTGLQMTSGSGNTNFSFKLSVGYSKMNRSRTSSFDMFLDVNRGLKKESSTTAMLSIGTSFYFGKR